MAAVAAVEVLKSPADRKSYRYVKLDNGISVLLIHDPEIALSAGGGEQEVCAAGMARASQWDGMLSSTGVDGVAGPQLMQLGSWHWRGGRAQPFPAPPCAWVG